MVGQKQSRWLFTKTNCSKNPQIKNWGLSWKRWWPRRGNVTFKYHISSATDLDTNFGCNWFRIIPDIVSKHLHIALWSSCALRFKYEKPCFLDRLHFICDSMGCKLWLWLIQNHSRHCSKLLALPFEVALLFDLNLSRCPFLKQVIYQDLLLCTGFNKEHAVLFLCHMFTQRPMNDGKIEWSNGGCFGWQQLLANSIKIFISHENKMTCCCQISTKH